MPTKREIEKFKQAIWAYYTNNKREFLWRETTDPYKILVSEIMLQQTQTSRVLPKYHAFIQEFPDFPTLAHTPFRNVLNLWSGLGYNRRALYLQKSAQKIVQKFNAKLPQDPEILVTFPGIGKATACSIIVFSYNTPLSFIETNIRRVFIYFFFPDREKVHDASLLPLVELTLDKTNPREWYYALIDYGAMLAKNIKNPNIKSAHYTKQSQFEGSLRQVRGTIIRILLKEKDIKRQVLGQQIISSTEYFLTALNDLQKEGFLEVQNGIVSIKKVVI